jgi:CubicO group peptidase (beta-lactamase class C family)
MLRKLKLIGQILLLQLTAKSQAVPFEELPFTNPLQTTFDSILHEQVKTFFKKSKAPGLIIGISRDGKRSYYNYGFSDTAVKKQFNSATVFEAGSITKTFVANLLLQLEAEKILTITDPIVKYLPDSLKINPVLSEITLASLASHISGLPRLPSNYDKVKEYTLMQPYKFYKREHLYTYLKNIKSINKGTYAYSNLGFGLLGTILENKTGKNLETLLAEYILRPVGMSSSYITLKRPNADTATGHFYGRTSGYWEFDCMAGAGALKSNAEDMLKYLEAHISPPSNDKLSTAIKKATQPVKSAGPGMQVCYGWHTFEELKHRSFWHDGGTYGFSTLAAFEPTTKTAVIFASNIFNVNPHLEKLAVDLMIITMDN